MLIDPEHDEDELICWLSELRLLHNIPFQYLIPSPEMLPYHSVRFFYLNNNWQKALIDGACSIGRNSSIDMNHDQSLIDAVFSQTNKRIKAVRPMLQQKRLQLNELQEEVDVIGGFILHSPLVRGWRGLQFEAFSENKQSLRALRIETLSDEVLIGLYDGVPHDLHIAQPPEGLHFGFNNIKGNYFKRLRELETGELLPESEKIEVVIENKKRRTIDVLQTTKNMELFFNKELTSAEFALQMIKTPYVGVIERTNKN